MSAFVCRLDRLRVMFVVRRRVFVQVRVSGLESLGLGLLEFWVTKKTILKVSVMLVLKSIFCFLWVRIPIAHDFFHG